MVAEKLPDWNVGSLDRTAWKKKVPAADAGTMKVREHCPSSGNRHVKRIARSVPTRSDQRRNDAPALVRETTVATDSPAIPATDSAIGSPGRARVRFTFSDEPGGGSATGHTSESAAGFAPEGWLGESAARGWRNTVRASLKVPTNRPDASSAAIRSWYAPGAAATGMAIVALVPPTTKAPPQGETP